MFFPRYFGTMLAFSHLPTILADEDANSKLVDVVVYVNVVVVVVDDIDVDVADSFGYSLLTSDSLTASAISNYVFNCCTQLYSLVSSECSIKRCAYHCSSLGC